MATRHHPHRPPTELHQVITMVRWLLYGAFVVVGYYVATYAAGVIGPVLVAFGIAYLTSPVLDWLTRRGFSRSLGALAMLLALIGLVVISILFVVPRAAHQFSIFADKLPQLLADGAVWVEQTFDVELPATWRKAFEGKHLAGMVGDPGPVADLAVAAVGGVFTVLGTVVELLMVLVFTFYFLVDFPHMQARVVQLIPPRRRGVIIELLREIDGVVAGWVRGQALVMVILAALYVVGFSIAGMSLAIPVGLVVGLLTVIPFIGAVIGAVLAVGITLADGGDARMLAIVTVVLVALHLLEAAVLTPKIVGHKVGLSESAALFAVFAGGKVLGFVGVLLAVPIAATVAVLIRHAVRFYEHTEFFGDEADAEVPVTNAMAMIAPAELVQPFNEPLVEPLIDVVKDDTLANLGTAADAIKKKDPS